MIRVESLKRFLVCHVERSETSLAMTLTLAKRSIQRFFSRDCGIRMTMPVEGLRLQRFN